ncbi:uncharacterized protein LOC114541895 [Dendronephthya gigantea]|uniref:uncharacterized protein LOC114541895 n=1 Tax=Dendronephthya gigantea TaxID=151771 RepID=UPI00106B1AFA|nr:uncharacterized protein LOC114541895 [Dendronephthya gigantea]
MYIFEGSWLSKMLVDYKVNDEKKNHEAHGTGSLILLPNNATNIKVRFQVMRFPDVWSDVNEYDGFKECWVKPNRPCIFKYDRPVSRTYTICNVMKITEDGSIISGDLIHYNGCSLIHVRVAFQGIPSIQAPKNGQATKSSSAMNISTHESTLKVPVKIASAVSFNVGGLMTSFVIRSDHEPLGRYGIIKSEKFRKQTGSTNNEWFEENVFDENCDIKEVCVNELRSERFSWIKDFHIGIDEGKKSWQMSITYARNTEPSMEDLKKLFGDNIASFVEFIQESDDEDEERLRTSSCFLRAPSSGDTLYVQNEERGTIAVLAAQVRSNKKHYAITSYHVCYCFNDLPENIFEAHNKLKEDCCSNDAAGCIGSRYEYMNQETVLGVFECGLYDDKNDIGLIQLTPELTCVDAIAVLVNEVESQLLSKKQVWEIFKTYMKMGKLPKVKKYGSESDETEGELFAITTSCLPNDMNLGFYKIRGKHADDFARKGDSGALVCIVHESKNLPFAIVSNHVPNANVYYCPNLHQSIEALNKKYSWINIKPCIRQCGRS